MNITCGFGDNDSHLGVAYLTHVIDRYIASSLVPKSAADGFDPGPQNGRRRLWSVKLKYLDPQWRNLENTSHNKSTFTGGIIVMSRMRKVVQRFTYSLFSGKRNPVNIQANIINRYLHSVIILSTFHTVTLCYINQSVAATLPATNGIDTCQTLSILTAIT